MVNPNRNSFHDLRVKGLPRGIAPPPPSPLRTFQGEEPLDIGDGRVFSLDASFGLLATASASALALFLGSALSSCGVSCMI